MGAKVTKASFNSPKSSKAIPTPLSPRPGSSSLSFFYRLARCKKQSCKKNTSFNSPPAGLMTANSSSSAMVAIRAEESTTPPQADPLPTKRGELGYRESLNPPAPSNAEPETGTSVRQTTLPARHPADREPPPPSELPTPAASASENRSSFETQPLPRSGVSSFRSRVAKQGVRTSTIFLLVTQGSLLLLTVSLWVILAKLVLPVTDAGRTIATSVFVHLTFVVCTLVQIVLLERHFFRYRAERYAMLHPGEVLPDMFNRGEQTSTRLALAPWNRPPLPTVRYRRSRLFLSFDVLNADSRLFSVRGCLDGVRGGNWRR